MLIPNIIYVEQCIVQRIKNIIYIYIYLHIYIYIYTYIYIYVYTYVYSHTYMYIQTYIYTYVRIYVYEYIYIYIYVYICIYVSMYIHICICIHIYALPDWPYKVTIGLTFQNFYLPPHATRQIYIPKSQLSTQLTVQSHYRAESSVSFFFYQEGDISTKSTI